jgi:hypothetical protein
MKKLLLLPLLLMLAGCETQNEKYEAAKALAAGTKAPNLAFAFGFSPGMPEGAASRQREKLRGTSAEWIKLPYGSSIQAENIELGYANHKLASVTVYYPHLSALDYQELENMLGKRYGSGPKQFAHSSTGPEETSWFSGPVEIELRYDKQLGGWLQYLDLRLESQYLTEHVDQILRERAAEEAAEKKESEKL